MVTVTHAHVLSTCTYHHTEDLSKACLELDVFSCLAALPDIDVMQDMISLVLVDFLFLFCFVFLEGGGVRYFTGASEPLFE